MPNTQVLPTSTICSAFLVYFSLLCPGATHATLWDMSSSWAIQPTPWEMLSSPRSYKPHHGRCCLQQGHKSHPMGDVFAHVQCDNFYTQWAPINISSLSLYSTLSCPLNQNSCFPHRKHPLFLHIDVIT